MENENKMETLTGHISCVNTVAISPDGLYFASGSDDRVIKIWKIVNGLVIAKLTGHTSSVTSIAISMDNTFLVSGSED